jgi:hypothetical protein
VSSAASSGQAERSGWLSTSPPWMAARITVAVRCGSAEAPTYPASRIRSTPRARKARQARMPSAMLRSSSGSVAAACVASEPMGHAHRPRPM